MNDTMTPCRTNKKLRNTCTLYLLPVIYNSSCCSWTFLQVQPEEEVEVVYQAVYPRTKYMWDMIEWSKWVGYEDFN